MYKFTKEEENELHQLFDLTIIIKGIRSIFDISFGVTMLFVTPQILNNWLINIFGSMDNLENRNFIVRYIIHFTEGYTTGAGNLIAFYFLSHGLIKAFTMYNLWKERMWAFPTAIVLLFAVDIYQVFKFIETGSKLLLVATIVDLLVIWLIYHEWQRKLKVLNK